MLKVNELEFNKKYYTAKTYQIGRYEYVEKQTTESVDGVKIDYTFTDISGRNVGFSVEEIETFFFITFEEAKSLAVQNWQAEKARMDHALSEYTEEKIDEMETKLKAKAGQ
jgi:hypothetical protein